MHEFMGVNIVEASGKFDGDFEKLANIEFPKGVLEAGAGSGYILDSALNDAFKAVNRLLKKGVKVYRTDENLRCHGKVFKKGSFYITPQEGRAQTLRRRS